MVVGTLLRRIDRLPGCLLSLAAGLSVVPNFLAVYLLAAPAAAPAAAAGAGGVAVGKADTAPPPRAAEHVVGSKLDWQELRTTYA